MKVIAGAGGVKIAESLAKNLKTELVEVKYKKFRNQEVGIKIQEDLKREQVVIVQALSAPLGERLVELGMLASAAQSALAEQVIAALPWLGYSRQDDTSSQGEAQSAQIIIKALEAWPIDRVITLDLHSRKVAQLFSVEHEDISAAPLFAQNLQIEKPEEWVVVSPDKGGRDRAVRLAKLLGLPQVTLTKKRIEGRQKVRILGHSPRIAKEGVILVDDIADSGETLLAAVAYLRDKRVKEIKVVVTHFFETNALLRKLSQSGITQILTTNSLGQKSGVKGKLMTLDIAPILAKLFDK